MIAIERLRYRNLAIEHLRITDGITSVIGPNGSGKTTLLRLLSGIAIPESGTILVDGIPPRNIEIGWVNEYPDRNILFGNAFEEIASPLRFRHTPCAEIDRSVASCMASLGISGLGTKPVRELSGGEKVLVALAAALVARPRVLVLDEYDSHLDADRTTQIARILKMSRIPCIIHCTQDMETAASRDCVIFLSEGKIRSAGRPEEVFASLGGTAFYPLSWRCRS